MATNLDIKVKSLIGAKPFLNYNPSENPTIGYPDGTSRSLRHELLDGSLRITSRRIRRAVELELDPIQEADQQAVSEIQETQQDVCISPPWTEDALTFLGLQGGLDDMREPLTRGTVTYARACLKANSVTGEWSQFDEPVYENCDPGKGISLIDPALIQDRISYEFKTFLTEDAEDAGGNTTLLTIPVADAVLLDAWAVVNDDVMVISTRDQSSNTHETFEIDSINTTTGIITASTVTGGAASAVLSGTSDYTTGKKTYITTNLLADGLMDEAGVGSWPQSGGATTEKSTGDRETGTRSLTINLPSAGNNKGMDTTIGKVGTPGFQASTDLAILFRYKIIFGTWKVNMTAAGGVILDETLSGSDWTDFHASWNVGASGAGVDFKILGDSTTYGMIRIDRAEIYINKVPNGSMEGDGNGLYDAEDTVATSTAGTTTFDATHAIDGTAWDLSNVVPGMIAEADGKEGLITVVDDGTDTITVASWIGGTPANGNACTCSFAVAPGWNNLGSDVAADQLWQDDGEHGGDYAQGINVDAAGEGIQSGFTLLSGYWHLVGAYVDVDSGTARIGSSGGEIDLTLTTTAGYTFISGVGLMGGNRSIPLRSSGGAADFLVDDVMAIKLVGNPHDDAYHDFEEAISVDGFFEFFIWNPDYDSDADEYSGNPHHFDISRPTFDGDNRIRIRYNAGAAFIAAVTNGGATIQASKTVAFSAGDIVKIGALVSGTAGSLVVSLFVSIAGGAMTRTDSAASATIPPGLTRAWLRGGNVFTAQPHGVMSTVLVENGTSNWNTTAKVQALFDRYTEDHWLKHIRQVDGIQHRIRRLEVTPYAGQPELAFGTLQLEERFRNAGAFIATQD